MVNHVEVKRPLSNQVAQLRNRLKEEVKDVRGLPVGQGQNIMPHVVSFQGIISSAARVYRASDEAMKASYENARFMRNDLMIEEPVNQRIRACALLNWHIEVDDPDNAIEKKLSEDVTRLIKQIAYFIKFREALLEAEWLGKAGVQWSYRWRNVPGCNPVSGLGMNQVLGCEEEGEPLWLPVHGDKIVYGFVDGSGIFAPRRVGIRIGAAATAAATKLMGKTDAYGNRRVMPTDYGLAYFLDEDDKRRICIHKHQIQDGEYEDLQSAGKIHGVGIRSRVYWSWYMKQELFAFLMDFLEKSASGGIEIWYYPSGNDEAEAKVRTAAEQRLGNARNVILMPRPVGEDANAYGVEIVPCNMAGAETIMRIIEEYFGDLIMRYVLGQTMTNKPQSAGLGSDLPQIQLGSYLQIIRYDAINLGETLTYQMVKRLISANWPHLTNVSCRFVIDTESEDMESKLKAWREAYDCGLRTKAADWYKMIGASKPEEQDEIIENPVTKQQDRLYQQWLEQKNQAEALGVAPPAAPGMQQPGNSAQAQGGLGEEPTPEEDAPLELEDEEQESYAADRGGDDELFRGIEEEMREHGMDEAEARKTAMDHLRENPHYYSIIDKALRKSSYKLASSHQSETWTIEDEQKHPRDEEGKWMSVTRVGEGNSAKWIGPKGEPLPAHHAKTYIPPAWTDVEVSLNPEHHILARGKDLKGRKQSIYQPEFVKRQAEDKFNRNREMLQKMDEIRKQNDDNLESNDPTIKELAAVTMLIQSTGIRPGSDRDTKAAKQAYGATTLRAEHVVSTPEGVVLKFTGKKGVDLSIPVGDKRVADMLLSAKQTAPQRGGRLFAIDDKRLREYTHKLDGGKFKPKDFRTAVGTSTAAREIENMPMPKNEKEYKLSVRQVAKVVSEKLGNTPTIALQSYINPFVFSKWKLNYGKVKNVA
jgi:DNA topoisomerase-1